MYTLVPGFIAVDWELCGRFTSRPLGNTNELVAMKKISRRNITSVIEAIENVAVTRWCLLSILWWRRKD
jgi:hypothetical protein